MCFSDANLLRSAILFTKNYKGTLKTKKILSNFIEHKMMLCLTHTPTYYFLFTSLKSCHIYYNSAYTLITNSAFLY